MEKKLSLIHWYTSFFRNVTFQNSSLFFHQIVFFEFVIQWISEQKKSIIGLGFVCIVWTTACIHSLVAVHICDSNKAVLLKHVWDIDIFFVKRKFSILKQYTRPNFSHSFKISRKPKEEFLSIENYSAERGE